PARRDARLLEPRLHAAGRAQGVRPGRRERRPRADREAGGPREREVLPPGRALGAPAARAQRRAQRPALPDVLPRALSPRAGARAVGARMSERPTVFISA